jgi:serine/threonine protein kinase
LSLTIPSLLKNRYRIEAILAESGMGTIYQAQDETLNIKVAVKENRYTTEVHSRQFRQEATLLAGLRHPNLPRVIDHFVLPDQGEYLVMDLIAGQDLKQILENQGQPLTEAEVVQIGLAVCDALAYLHDHKPPIIHRDIKPANLKRTPEGRIVLVDFGLAKFYEQGELTTTGAQGLTAGYAPIEQYGQGTDPRSDIYALGATLYTLLTGIVPPESLTRAMDADPLRPIADFNPEISPALANVIAKAMAVRPEDRYATTPDFCAALQALSGPGESPAQPVSSQPKAKQTQAKPKKRSVWAWLAPVLVILLAAAAGGIFLLNRNNSGTASPPPPTPTETPASEVVTPTPQERTAAPAPTETQAVAALPATPTETPLATALPQPQLAFVSEREGLPQIYLIHQDGSGLRALTANPEGACQPTWSPDGAQLAYISPCPGLQERYDGASIFVLTLSTGRSDLISTLATGDYDPAWSPDGSRLAFTSLQTGKPQIFIYTFESGQATILMNRSIINRMPAWSADGSQIVFVAPSPVNNQPILYRVDAEGVNDPILVLGQSDIPALRPAWSIADDLILFESAGGQIGQVSPSGGLQSPLETGLARALTVTISPDGSQLALAGNDGGDALDIYLFSTEDGTLIPLTMDSADDYSPAWRP